MPTNNHADAMAHFLGIEAEPTDTQPEPTDPGDLGRNPATLHLAAETGWAYARAQVERRRLFRLAGSTLREIADDGAPTPNRTAALWELDRRHAKGAGDPWPPVSLAPPTSMSRTSIPVPAPAPADTIDAAGHAVGYAAGELQSGTSLAANVDGWTSYGGVDRSGENRSGWHLEAVRDALRAREAQLQPVDMSVSSSRLVLTSDTDCELAARFIQRDGAMSDPMPVTGWARAQLAQRMMPAHALGILKDAASLQVQGRPIGQQLVSGLWNAYAHGRTVEGLQVRTVCGMGGERAIRAFLSSTYNVYDALQMAEDMLDTFGASADLWRVIAYRADEAEARVSMVGGTPEGVALWADNAIDKPIPIIRWGDAEGGQGSAFVEGGTWTTWCSNTMGALSDNALHRFRHAGGTSDTIRQKVAGATEDCLTIASGAVRMYDDALATGCSDILAWFDQVFAGEVTGPQRAQLETIVVNEPTVHGGTRLLAGVVDGLTFLGHEITDWREGERVERLAAKVMIRGLDQAENGRILVEA